ncbi:MAG: hypothetical protein AB7I27_16065 [Bacteriovoracaceae bacterium]
MKFLYIFLITFTAYAANTDFHPVTSIKSRTIKKGTIAFNRSPLGNINSTFLVNTLNYGAFSRFEIGTAPLFYTSKDHKYNYVLKLNFWKSDWIDWSLAYGETRFRTHITYTNGEKENPDMILESSQLALNLHPPEKKYSIGLFYTFITGQINSKNIFVLASSLKYQREYGMDIQYQVKENQWLTLGLANLRDTGISPYENTSNGVGGAYTWFREKQLLSRPSVGIYQSFKGEVQLLFATTFYEEK